MHNANDHECEVTREMRSYRDDTKPTEADLADSSASAAQAASEAHAAHVASLAVNVAAGGEEPADPDAIPW